MLESSDAWEENGRIFARARFEGSKKGIAAAEAHQAYMHSAGFRLIDVQTTGGGTNVARSLGKSALGLGLLGATGFGFLGTSRKRIEIAALYEKVGPSTQEVADEQLFQTIRTTGAQIAASRSSLLSRAVAGELPFRARVEQAQPRGGGWLQRYSVDFTVLVGNGTDEAFDGFELEVLLHNEAGDTVASASPSFQVVFPSQGFARVTFSIGGLRQGDVGTLIAVRRVLRGGQWQSV